MSTHATARIMILHRDDGFDLAAAQTAATDLITHAGHDELNRVAEECVEAQPHSCHNPVTDPAAVREHTTLVLRNRLADIAETLDTAAVDRRPHGATPDLTVHVTTWRTETDQPGEAETAWALLDDADRLPAGWANHLAAAAGLLRPVTNPQPTSEPTRSTDTGPLNARTPVLPPGSAAFIASLPADLIPATGLHLLTFELPDDGSRIFLDIIEITPPMIGDRTVPDYLHHLASHFPPRAALRLFDRIIAYALSTGDRLYSADRYGPPPTTHPAVDASDGDVLAALQAMIDNGPGRYPDTQHPGGPGVPLTHTDLWVPHTRLRITALRQHATDNGVAFTAEVALDNTLIGTIDNDGNGGATWLRANTGHIIGRQFRDYIDGCRRDGHRVDEEDVLNALIDEYVTDQIIRHAHRNGTAVVRLLDNNGRVLNLLSIGDTPSDPAERSTTVADLHTCHGHPDGAAWEIWSGTRWQHLDHHPATGPTRRPGDRAPAPTHTHEGVTMTETPTPSSGTPTYPDVTVRLTGEDGNAYAIIAAVARALRRQVSPAAATSFTDKAFTSHSYDDLLNLAQHTVNVI
jgi:hypothetical protein